MNGDGVSGWPRYIVGGIVMLLVSGINVGLFLHELPIGNREVALVVLGIVIGWGGNVVNYHYSTSEGSRRKTDIIAEKASVIEAQDIHSKPDPN